MDAVKYFEEKRRMTKWTGNNTSCTLACVNCPLFSKNNKHDISCDEFEIKHPKEAVKAVEEWAKKHPQKTFLTDFLEKHPKAPMEDELPSYTCPTHLGYIKK